MADTEQHLLRYKSHLERNPNEERLIQILTKLAKLPVTLHLLQSTGIGKTVNGFRKQDGDIGVTARTLVKNWKNLVAEETNQETAYSSHSPELTNHKQSNKHDESNSRKSHNGREESTQSKSSSLQRHSDKHKNSKYPSEASHSKSSSHKSEHKREVVKHSHRKSPDDRHVHKSHKYAKPEESPEKISSNEDDAYEDRYDDDEQHFSDDVGDESDARSAPEIDSENSRDSFRNYNDEAPKKSSSKSHNDSGSRKSSSWSFDDNRSHKSSSKSKHHSDKGSSKSDSGSKDRPKSSSNKSSSQRPMSSSDVSRHGNRDRGKSSTSHNSTDNTESASTRKSSSGLVPKDEMFGPLSPDEEVKTEEKKKSSKSSSQKRSIEEDGDHSLKKRHKSGKEENKKAVKRSADNSVHNPSDSEDTPKVAKIEKTDKLETTIEDDDDGVSFEDMLSYDQGIVKKILKKKKDKVTTSLSSNSNGAGVARTDSKSSSHSKCEKSNSESSKKDSSSEKKRSSSEKKHSSSEKKHSSAEKKHLESSKSDSNSGKSHSHSSKSHSSSSKSHSSSSKSSGSSSRHSSKEKHRRKHTDSGKSTSSLKSDAASYPVQTETNLTIPEPPKQEIKLTDSDIMGYLPETQAYYKPLRLQGMEDRKGKFDDVNSVDPMLIGSKSYSRTQVYSGRKATGLSGMVSLYDQCLRVLTDNVDCLDYVGGVPYYILKPVLEKCTADQLYRLEDFNPQFLGETDELWQILCNRDFRGTKPDEMESWRELYLRRYDEREVKLQKLKVNIAAAEEARKAPVRLTKLAYVDTVAKPPRDVRRKQLKYGTATVETNPSSSKLSPAGYQRSSLKSRLAMDTGPVIPQKAVKVAAPMMQKTMKMIKKLQYRR